MVDLEYLSKLLPVLRLNRVESFTSDSIHMKFYVDPELGSGAHHLPTQDHTVELPINESELPPDLRTDNVNSMDTILNWSGAPDTQEVPLPGVGEDE